MRMFLLTVLLLMQSTINIMGMNPPKRTPQEEAKETIDHILKERSASGRGLELLPDHLQKMPDYFFKAKEAQQLIFILLQIVVYDQAPDAKECIKILMEKGTTFDPSMMDTSNNNLLHLACWQGNLRALKAILAQSNCKDLINKVNATGDTPLYVAVQRDPEFVKELITAGADVKVQNKKIQFDYKRERLDTPLHRAASSSNNPETIQLLIDAGADVNAQDVFDTTPLHLAAWYELEKVVDVLLARGTNVNAQRNELGNYDTDGWTPLHDAAFRGNAQIINHLIAFGANTEIKDKKMQTPLVVAISTLRFSTAQPKVGSAVELLIGLGAELKFDEIRSALAYTDVKRYLLSKNIIEKENEEKLRLNENELKTLKERYKDLKQNLVTRVKPQILNTYGTGPKITIPPVVSSQPAREPKSPRKGALSKSSSTGNPLADKLDMLMQKLIEFKGSMQKLQSKLEIVKNKLGRGRK